MDKQQAKNYILDRLKAGAPSAAITDGLSRKLKVPPEKVRSFVDQVAAAHPDLFAPPPPAQAPSAWMEPLNIYPEEAVSENLAPELQSQIDALPPGLQALLNENPIHTGIFSAPAVEPVPNTGTGSSPEPAPPRQAAFGSPGAENPESPELAESSEIDLEALREFTLGQLKRRQRNNDIVETVCRKTGWHWNKSQRFVARLKTKNYSQLKPIQNQIMMATSIGMLLIGAVLTIGGIGVITSHFVALAELTKTNPNAVLQPPASMALAPQAGIIGLFMILGGSFGLARALTER